MTVTTTDLRSTQVTGTFNQSVAGSTTVDVYIPLEIFASNAIFCLIATSPISGGTAGYPGLIAITRPSQGTGRTVSIMVNTYPGAFESTLISQLSDALYGGCRLNDAYIDNANSRLVLSIRNPTAGTLSFSGRVTGVAFP